MKCCTRSLPASLRSKIFPIARTFLVGALLILPGFTRLEGVIVPPACPCTLAWNLNQDASVTGYALYSGITGSTTNRQALGMINIVTLFNLLTSSNYFFYVVAYNAKGDESPPSKIVYYKAQVLSSLKLTTPVPGTMNLQFRAAPGTVCRVQYTPSPGSSQWQTLGSAIADASGNITITDRPPGNTPSRYYRAVTP